MPKIGPIFVRGLWLDFVESGERIEAVRRHGERRQGTHNNYLFDSQIAPSPIICRSISTILEQKGCTSLQRSFRSQYQSFM